MSVRACSVPGSSWRSAVAHQAVALVLDHEAVTVHIARRDAGAFTPSRWPRRVGAGAPCQPRYASTREVSATGEGCPRVRAMACLDELGLQFHRAQPLGAPFLLRLLAKRASENPT